MPRNPLAKLAPLATAAALTTQVACSDYNYHKKHDPWVPQSSETTPEPIDFNPGKIIEACFPNQSIVPIHLETGDLDTEGLRQFQKRTEDFRARVLEMAQNANPDQAIEWDTIIEGDVPFTVFAERKSVLEPNFQYGITSGGESTGYLDQPEDWTWSTYYRTYFHFEQDHNPLENFSISEGRDYTNPEVVRCTVKMISPEFNQEEVPKAEDMLALRTELDPLTLTAEVEEDSLQTTTNWHIFAETGDMTPHVIGFHVGDATYDMAPYGGESNPVSPYSHSNAHTEHGIAFAETVDAILASEGNHQLETRSFPEEAD